MYRSHTCGELRAANINQTVTLAGWVQKVRNLGAMAFIDLRDRYGITQIVVEEGSNEQTKAAAARLGREFVIQVTGRVIERSSKNPKMDTGDIEVVAEKSGRYLGIDCEVDGKVVVECDRCLEDLDIPIGTDIMLSVKYGSEENSEDHQEGEREVLFIPQDEAELDLSQIIYDYVCLSLPMQRMHDEGDCNPEVMKRYGAPEETEVSQEEGVSPFSALKGMFQ